MTDVSAIDVPGLRGKDRVTPLRIAESALSRGGRAGDLANLNEWFAGSGRSSRVEVDRTPLESLAGWHHGPVTGAIAHESGRFFTVEGLEIHIPDAPVSRWSQPIINQPEVGILGVLAKEFDGVLHLLMQAKVEPGNCNGLQVSPTVQATRSNYMRIHRGKSVPYLEYFRETVRHRVLVDVRQSEQGSSFYQKRNRNMVVETTDDVEALDGFRWLTLGQVHQLLALDDVVNMDARTVLSCLPFSGANVATAFDGGGSGFRAALIRSCDENSGSRHAMDDILSWITEARTRTVIRTRRIPLDNVQQWRRVDGRISHESGLFFSVIGVDVHGRGREVEQWMQPMFEPHGTGVVAFLVRPIGGVLHALVHARVEAGYLDVAELAPTVQCTPDSYDYLPAAARPAFLDEVLAADPGQIRFDAVLSEEGGRFFHARNRYTIIEATPDTDLAHPDFRWMALHQIGELLRHSHYLNVQARSLVACLYSLAAR
jgi:oxidase EvaA